MLTVAIAAENDLFDAEIYRLLAECVLGVPVAKWPSGLVWNGYRSVWKQVAPFLDRAADRGVRHAIFAVDNDGGSRGPEEHDASHDLATHADEDRCRVCWLQAAIPASWTAAAGRTCVAVPVQALETWLLHLRGETLKPSPEKCYDRGAMKRRFFGSGTLPPIEKRVALAVREIQRPDALNRLRERRSFQHLESQLAA